MPNRPLIALLGSALCAGALLATDPPAGNPSAVAKAMAARYRKIMDRLHPGASPEATQALAEPLRALQAGWTRLASTYDLQAKYAERLANPSTTASDRTKLIGLLDQVEASLAEQTRMECTVHIALVQRESLAIARQAQGALAVVAAGGKVPAHLIPPIQLASEVRAISLWLNEAWDRIALASPWTAWRKAPGDYPSDSVRNLTRDWQPVPGVELPCFLVREAGKQGYVFVGAVERERTAERRFPGGRPEVKAPAGEPPKPVPQAPRDIRHTHAWHEANRERNEKRREEKHQRAREEAERKAEALRARQAREALEAQRVREHAERQRLRAREEREAAHARLVARREAREQAEAARARKEERRRQARETSAMAAADTWTEAGPSPARSLPPTAEELEDLRSSPGYVTRFLELAYSDEAAFAEWQRGLLWEATAALRPEGRQ